MEIDVAEIPPLAGFTSKELDSEPGLYRGIYSAIGGRARYYNPWSVKHPALPRQVVARRGRSWLSVDPLAKKYKERL